MGRYRNLGRRLVFRLLRITALPWLIRHTLQRRRVTIILYHDPDPALLGRHLAALRRRYTIIPLRQYVEALRAGTVGQLPARALVITLDDGHRGNARLMAVLERAGVPVTIFLNSQIVGTNRRYWFLHVSEREELKRVSDDERLTRLREGGFEESGEDREALSHDEVRAMAGPLVDFQSHGCTHPVLPACDGAKARAEIVDSRRELTERYGLDIYAFSYPNGDYGERELALVQEAGYACGVTVDLGFNGSRTDPHRLKRICIDDADGVDELLVKTCGLWGAVSGLVDEAARVRGRLRPSTSARTAEAIR